MDIGVWMSKETLARKRESGVAVQVWNLPHLPKGFADAEPGRLFVAVDGHWRGFFRLTPGTLQNDTDRECSCAVVYDPVSWTPVLPEKAPHETRRISYTLDVPAVDVIAPGRTKRRNEDPAGEFISLLQQEEKRE